MLRDLEPAVRRSGGATTACIAEVTEGSALITWIGDSSAYRLTSHGAEPLGLPHHSPDGRLTQALGFRGRGQTVTTSLESPLLLCTDGIARREIPPFDGDLAHWARRLVDRVYQMGATDNLTFVAIRRRSVS